MPRPRRNAPEADAEPPPDPIELLAPARRETLDRAVMVLADYSPVPGALGDLPQVTVPSGQIESACAACRDDAGLDCRMLLCLACVDYEERFELVYFLQSLSREQSLVVKTAVSYDDPALPSVARSGPRQTGTSARLTTCLASRLTVIPTSLPCCCTRSSMGTPAADRTISTSTGSFRELEMSASHQNQNDDIPEGLRSI